MQTGGWYPDPQGPRGRMRWWDGTGWSEHTAADGAPETTRPAGVREPRDQAVTAARLRRFGLPVAVIAVLAALIVVPMAVHGESTGGTPIGGPPISAGPGSTDSPPPLSQLCQNTAPSSPGRPVGPGRGGARTTDPSARLSYARLGAPWTDWNLGTWGQTSGAGLGERFSVGQYFVTQQLADGPYLASILSGTVPATYGDDAHPNIACAARVIADDVRKRYYPQPNQRTDGRSELLSVGGRPAYLMRFHLAFDQAGNKAKGEQVAICVVDMPGRKASAIYISIPDTHKQYDRVIDQVVQSLRIAG